MFQTTNQICIPQRFLRLVQFNIRILSRWYPQYTTTPALAHCEPFKGRQRESFTPPSAELSCWELSVSLQDQWPLPSAALPRSYVERATQNVGITNQWTLLSLRVFNSMKSESNKKDQKGVNNVGSIIKLYYHYRNWDHPFLQLNIDIFEPSACAISDWHPFLVFGT